MLGQNAVKPGLGMTLGGFLNRNRIGTVRHPLGPFPGGREEAFRAGPEASFPEGRGGGGMFAVRPGVG